MTPAQAIVIELISEEYKKRFMNATQGFDAVAANHDREISKELHGIRHNLLKEFESINENAVS